MPIREYSLSKILQHLDINYDEVCNIVLFSFVILFQYTLYVCYSMFHFYLFFNWFFCPFSLLICVFYLAVIIVIQLKVLDKNVHSILLNNIELLKQFLNILIKKLNSKQNIIRN